MESTEGNKMTKKRITKDRPKKIQMNVSISEAALEKIQAIIAGRNGVGAPATICKELLYKSLDISD